MQVIVMLSAPSRRRMYFQIAAEDGGLSIQIQLIGDSRSFHIFQIQLQGFFAVPFVGFEVIQHIHAGGEGVTEMSEAKADGIECRAAVICECEFEMFGVCADRAG